MAHLDSYQATPSAGQHCCPVCIIAVVKDPMTPCSRRCQWAGNGACAQCGRWLNPEDNASPTGPLPFCGASCHSQAYHANWCVGCGVRQRGYGAQSCGGDFCEAVSPGRIAMLAQGSKPSGRNPYRRPVPAPALVDPYTAGFLTEWQGVFVDPALAAASAAAMAGAVPWGDMMMPAAASPWVGSVPAVMAQAPVRRAPPAFEVLPAHDKHRQALEGLVRSHGFSVVGVIRLVGSAAAKKSYLAYRSRVESEIGAFKEAKYGFGGEGNEQRRFTPLGTSCNGESLVKNLLAMQRGGQQGAFDPCHDAACDVCRTLRLGGARLGAMNVASHYSITSMDSALGAAATLPKPSGSDNAPIAILVSRVVVGRPVVVESVSDMGMTLPPQQHSFVVSNGNGRQDGVYVLTDDAVDACHVVFACR